MENGNRKISNQPKESMKIVSSILRQIYSSVFFSSLSVYSRIRALNYDIGNTIVISGAPRSGTSWLAEILHTIPRTSILSEPIRADVDPGLRSLGFSGRIYIPPEAERPEAEEWMMRLLSGRILNYNTHHTTLREIMRCKHHIIKFISANRLLRWMAERFPIRPPILLIRHPCAVVASQMRYEGWKNDMCVQVDSRFLEAYQWVKDILRDIKTQEEVFAVTWCMDYFAVLSTTKPHPWILVTYEKLLNQGEGELQRIFNALEIDMPGDTVKRLKVPSWSSRRESPIKTGKDLQADWTTFLSQDQVKRILDLVSVFGLDFYGKDLETDYERLENQPVVRHS